MRTIFDIASPQRSVTSKEGEQEVNKLAKEAVYIYKKIAREICTNFDGWT